LKPPRSKSKKKKSVSFKKGVKYHPMAPYGSSFRKGHLEPKKSKTKAKSSRK
jgi:hypothetical protein